MHQSPDGPNLKRYVYEYNGFIMKLLSVIMIIPTPISYFF